MAKISKLEMAASLASRNDITLERMAVGNVRVEACLADDGAFAAAWRDSETQLRNAVALARAERLGKDPADARKWLRRHSGWSVELETGVTAAFAQPDPLARHLALQRLRWDRAGALAGLSPFSVEAFLAYALRLSILVELAAGADADAGLRKLNAAAGRA